MGLIVLMISSSKLGALASFYRGIDSHIQSYYASYGSFVFTIKFLLLRIRIL